MDNAAAKSVKSAKVESEDKEKIVEKQLTPVNKD